MIAYGGASLFSIGIGHLYIPEFIDFSKAYALFALVAASIIFYLGVLRTFATHSNKRVSPRWNYIPFVLLLLASVSYYYEMRTDRAACIGVLLFAWSLLPLEQSKNKVKLFWMYWSLISLIFVLFAVFAQNAAPEVFMGYSLEDWQTHVMRSTVSWGFFFFALTVSIYFYSKSNRLVSESLQEERLHSKVSDRLNKILAHNLRTPMSALKMQLEIERMKGQEHSRLSELVSDLISQTDQLLSYNGSSEDFDVNKLVMRLEKEYTNKVVVDPQVQRNFDIAAGNAMYYSLQNFVGNALKFSNVPPTVTIKSFYNELVFIVEDHGLGMSAEQLNAIGTKTKSKTGLGIGLQLSFELLTSFGYHVIVQSVEGIGTKVVFAKDELIVESLKTKDWPCHYFRPDDQLSSQKTAI